MSRFLRMIDFEPELGGEGGEGGATGAEGLGAEGGQGTGSEGGAAERTFTQADLDRVVQERLARQKAQFAGFDELKAKAEEFDKLQEANKTELEKATERAAAAEAQAAEAIERAKSLVTDSSIIAAATGKLADPTDALAMLDRKAIEYGEDGTPSNVAALVDALIETKPHLAAPQGNTRRVVDIDGGARGGSGGLDPAALMGLDDASFMKALGQV